MSEDIRSLLDDMADFIAKADPGCGGVVSQEMIEFMRERIEAARQSDKIGVAWSDPNSEPIPAEPNYLGLSPIRVEGAPLIDDKEPWRWGL